MTDLVGLTPILEIHVIRVNCNNMRGSGQEGAPVMQGFDDCKEFQIVDVIIMFCLDESHGVVTNGMTLVVFASL